MVSRQGMQYPGSAMSSAKSLSVIGVLIAGFAFATQSHFTAALKVQQTTDADNVQAYKLMNTPPNSTGSCKSRFGDGAQAGKLDCECRGGFKWNANKTQCVPDGTEQLSYLDRLQQRIFRRSGSTASAGSAESRASRASVQSKASAVSHASNASKPMGCFVKGAVTPKGDKVYVIPGCPNFDKIKIDLAKKEKTFCTEDLAIKAGWTKSKDCPK